MQKLLCVVALGFGLQSQVLAGDFGQIATQLVGYTIVGVRTVVAYKDQDQERVDGFKGCQFGRAIIFSDNKYVMCQGYGYHYASRPEAVLLVQQGVWKMVIEDEVFDVSLR